MKTSIVFAALTLLLLGCSSSPKIRDITELFPPKQVRAYFENDGYRIRWDPSIDEGHPDFLGYNIYSSTQRLINVPVKNLPRPVLLGKSEHEYKLTNLDPTQQYFIHVRSRNRKGDISLPSLPEIAIQTTASF